MKQYFVYIMTNRSQTLYVGVTGNLMRRVYEHKMKLISGFTARYNIGRLVYFSETNDVHTALQEEKRIKGWLRAKKVALIETINPGWADLSEDWFQNKRDPERTETIPLPNSRRSFGPANSAGPQDDK